MKAVVPDEYGPPDGLRLAEVAKPLPKENKSGIAVPGRRSSSREPFAPLKEWRLSD
jgi:hypothetical protein